MRRADCEGHVNQTLGTTVLVKSAPLLCHLRCPPLPWLSILLPSPVPSPPPFIFQRNFPFHPRDPLPAPSSAPQSPLCLPGEARSHTGGWEAQGALQTKLHKAPSSGPILMASAQRPHLPGGVGGCGVGRSERSSFPSHHGEAVHCTAPPSPPPLLPPHCRMSSDLFFSLCQGTPGIAVAGMKVSGLLQPTHQGQGGRDVSRQSWES